MGDADETESDQDPPPYIRIRIDPSRKKRWQEYAQQNHYGNLTSLIKTAVKNTISDEWILRGQTGIDELENLEISSDASQEIQSISEQISHLQTQIDELTLSSAGHEPVELSEKELHTIASKANGVIPRVASPRQLPSFQEIAHSPTIEPADRSKITGTIEDVAPTIGESRAKTRTALIWLEQNREQIQSVIEEGQRRFFEKDPSMSEFDVKESLPDDYDHEGFSGDKDE